MEFQREKSAGYLANHMARLFAAHLAEALAPLGLAPAQFMTLLELWEEPGLTQAELGQRLDVEQPTMAATLARMERDGLVTREAHEGDRRARRVMPSERAWALEAPAKAAAAGVNGRALAGLSEAERGALIEAMAGVIAALRR